MADYTTYATVMRNVTPSLIKLDSNMVFGRYGENQNIIVCLENDRKFESVLKILELEKDNLPELEIKYVSADHWRTHGWDEYEGDEDVLLSDLYWLNTTTLEWKGTDEEYERYEAGEEELESKYVKVVYGTFEDTYPELVDKLMTKKFKCIVFEEHPYNGHKAAYWTNWLGGPEAKYGDFDCLFFARDARNHINKKYIKATKKQIAQLIKKETELAKNHDEKLIVFGFG